MAQCKVCGFESKTGNAALDLGTILNHVLREHREEAKKAYDNTKVPNDESF